MIGASDVILLFLLVAGVACVAYGVALEVVHRWQCRRRARMAPWQRRALMDGKPRGFDVLPP